MLNIPVVKDLTAQDMSAYSPAVLIRLLSQPMVSKQLGVKVVCLIGRMMDVRFGTLKEEKAVVIHQFLSTVEMEERGDVVVVGVVDKLYGQLYGADRMD